MELSVPAAHCVPLNFKTWPVTGAVPFIETPSNLLTDGFGYVPERSPPAVPFGGNEAGITPGASFAKVTELFRILAVVIALFPIVGFGYVPDRSPPAAPFGGNEVGITPAASFDEVTDPSKILLVVIASTPMVGLGYVPDRSPPATPLGGSEVGITPAASF